MIFYNLRNIINSLTNSGLFENARLAERKNLEAQALEDIKIKISEVQIEKVGKATLVDLAKNLEEDEKNSYVITTEAKTASLTKDGERGITTVEGTITTSTQEIYVINMKYGYEIKITKDLVPSLTGSSIVAVKTSPTPQEIEGQEVIPQVGEIVYYAPSGTYSWDKSVAESGTTTSNSRVAETGTITLSSATGQDYNVTQWKILNYNSSTKIVEMVPVAPVGSLMFQGAQGNNNAVYLLNNACSSLYSTGTQVTARSIAEEDIVKAGKQSQSGDSESTNDWTRMRASWSNEEATYGGQLTSAYTAWKKYPLIFGQEKNKAINGTLTTTGLEQSEQISSISKTESGATDGYLEATTSIKTKQTYYNSTDYDTTYAKLADGKNSVLLASGNTTSYWVASRCIILERANCNFFVHYMAGGRLTGGAMFYSYGRSEGWLSTGLFPIVSLSSELLKHSTKSGIDYDVNI